MGGQGVWMWPVWAAVVLQAGDFCATQKNSGSYVDRFGHPPSVHLFAVLRCFLCFAGPLGYVPAGACYCPCTAVLVPSLSLRGDPGWPTEVRQAAANRKQSAAQTFRCRRGDASGPHLPLVLLSSQVSWSTGMEVEKLPREDGGRVLHLCSSGGVGFESRTLPHTMSALLVIRLVSFG